MKGSGAGVQVVGWSWWDGGVWCWGAGCRVVLVGWRGLVLGAQGVGWSWWDGGVWCWGCRV